MNAKACLFYLCLAGPAMAQGFAGLGSDSEGFALPQEGTVLNFPQDHGPHPQFRIEWWYVTANLHGADGQSYGAQWTLFRAALSPGESDGWQSPQAWMGHAALTSKDSHHVAERLARGGIGQAGVTLTPFVAFIDDWKMASKSAPGADEIADLEVSAAGTDFAYDLTLSAKGPIVLHGQSGYSVKSPEGQASHYYSQPAYKVSGQITLPGGPVAVTGQAWLDREWSSQPLSANQSGWDWFSLHFDDGTKLMGYRLRDSGAGFSVATWIAGDGRAEPQAPGALRVTPLETARVADHDIPVRWRIELPGKAINVTTKALNPNAWMNTQVPYWEGPVTVEGSHQGEGYVEMTGYQ